VTVSNVTKDLTQLGGLWSRRPLMGLAFLTGAAGLRGLPPLGGLVPWPTLVDHLVQSGTGFADRHCADHQWFLISAP